MPAFNGDQRRDQEDADARPAHRGFRERWRDFTRGRGAAQDDGARTSQHRHRSRSRMERNRAMSSKHAAAINHEPQIRHGVLRHRVDVIQRPARSFNISVERTYSVWPAHLFAEQVFKTRGYTVMETYECHVNIFGLHDKHEIRDMFERCKKVLQFDGYVDIYFHSAIEMEVLRRQSNTVSRDSGYSSERLRQGRVNRHRKPEYVVDDCASEDSESWDESEENRRH